MKVPKKFLKKASVLLIFGSIVSSAIALGFARDRDSDDSLPPAHYVQTNLVSNNGNAPTNDANLQNAWGLVAGPGTPWWVANNAGGTSTLYLINSSGTAATVIAGINPQGFVGIAPAPSQPAGSPTGVMFNGSSTDFIVPSSGAPALFIFVTEDGTVQAFPGVTDTKGNNNAVIVADNSHDPNALNGAVLQGRATIAEIDGKKFILAANFRSGRIDVFNSSFRPVYLSEDAFDDDRIPPGFAPFNVQGVGPNIYVTYAKQDASTNDPATNRHDPVNPGEPGDGFVDVFNTHGRLLQRLEHGPWFNAPWGVVWATQHFGEFSNTILIGQFRGFHSSPQVPSVAPFNPVTGRFLGNMLNTGSQGSPLTTPLLIDGLWALRFGNDGRAGPATTLFFTAGPDTETNGVLGTLTPRGAERGEGDEQ